MKKKIFSIAMALALIAILVMPMTAFAADTGDTTITANQSVAIDITVPATISWTFATANGTNSNPQNITVNTTGTWILNIKDAMDTFGTIAKPAGSGGKMVEASTTAYITPTPKILTNALVIDASGSGGNTDVTLTNTDAALYSGVAPFTGTKAITLKQTTTWADQALTGVNKYRIVVTFTASAL